MECPWLQARFEPFLGDCFLFWWLAKEFMFWRVIQLQIEESCQTVLLLRLKDQMYKNPPGFEANSELLNISLASMSSIAQLAMIIFT
ncbi:hypothetical protein Taro_033615, partial [Colocasia esculenta]|nr:hypothetical protein [Colocasia esculenta]